jgi:tetraacyldisaccharide 4'-kinase
MQPIVRILLFPIAALYGVGIWLRNKLFAWGVLKQTSFDKPVIVVGNISTGGTGKTPHVEYLIKLLSATRDIATLSRGYGRKSKGFLWVKGDGLPTEYGDEPLQLKQKFTTLDVAVCENRVKGINQILEERPYINTLLLDDAFQHRYVKPGLAVVLVDYHNLPNNDYLLPSGNLRESITALRRAHAIVVTKTSKYFSPLEREGIIQKLKVGTEMPVFFSYYNYGALVPFNENEVTLAANTNLNKDSNHNVLLLTGIANAEYMKDYLAETLLRDVHHMEFKDHYQFTEGDIDKLTQKFSTIAGKNRLIVTTEKDAVRLRATNLQPLLAGLPLFYMPVEVSFHGNDKEAFDKLVNDYVRNY